jgi:type IV secretory pathway VirB3-like protein
MIGVPFDFLKVLLGFFVFLYFFKNYISFKLTLILIALVYFGAIYLTRRDPNWCRIVHSNLSLAEPAGAVKVLRTFFKKKIYAP